MQATWSGSVSLGLVNFPVKLYRAIRQARPRFTQLHKKDLSPIERVAFCRQEQQEITKDEIIRGVKQADKYVTLTDDEIEQTAGPPSKTIEILQFCDAGQVDPIFYDKPYYLVADKGGERAYALVREALLRTNKYAVARFVMRGNEHIGVIRPLDGILMLQQLRFAAEIVPKTDLKTPPLQKPTMTELEAAVDLITRLSTPFFAEDYHDEQTDNLSELIERKAKGLPAKRAKPTPQITSEGELIKMLKASLDEPPAPSDSEDKGP